MRLSECIVLGSVGTNQAFNYLQDYDGSTCAMGAAMVGAGLEPIYWSAPQIVDKFPFLNHKVTLPPGIEWKKDSLQEGESYSKDLWGAIAMLNNEYRWTRPQIAAWVAEQEVRLGIVDAEVKQEVSEV